MALCSACRPRQDNCNNRETGQLSLIPLIFHCTAFRSRSLHSRNWPTSLIKPNWSDTSPPGCVRGLLIAPMQPSRRSPRTPLCRRRVRMVAVTQSPSRYRDSPIGRWRCHRDRLRPIRFGYDARWQLWLTPARLCLHNWSQTVASDQSARPPLRSCSDRRTKAGDAVTKQTRQWWQARLAPGFAALLA